MSLIISIADKSDYPEISQVGIICWRDAYKEIFPKKFLAELSIESRTNSRESFFDSDNKVTFILKKENTIIGFCDVGESRIKEFAEGEIYSLYVLPEFKGRGFGKKLIKHAIDWLEKRKMTPFIVTTLEKNINAQKFYEKLGFKAIGKILTEVGDNVYPEIVFKY